MQCEQEGGDVINNSKSFTDIVTNIDQTQLTQRLLWIFVQRPCCDVHTKNPKINLYHVMNFRRFFKVVVAG